MELDNLAPDFGKSKWEGVTHPPIEDRIKALEGLNAKDGLR